MVNPVIGCVIYECVGSSDGIDGISLLQSICMVRRRHFIGREGVR